jgi:hypothetical protein
MVGGGYPALQAAYERHGVAIYPLGKDKSPAVRGYARVGVNAARQLATKFVDATAGGFIAGNRNRLTIVDVDSSDDRLTVEIERRFGRSPLVVVTPSGGRHLYFRHNGELRRIRALPEVDILGDGNVVAAGSRTSRGVYRIERGSLDDLDKLPPIRSEAPETRQAARIPEGQRNKELFRYCRKTVGYCDSLDQLLDAAQTWADRELAAPLPAAEIVKTCNSVWQYRGGRRLIMNNIVEAGQYAALVSNKDALALFAFLSAENGPGSKFMIADGLARATGWPRRFVPAARKALLSLGLVECVRPRGKNAPALYQWRQPT